MLKIFKLVLFKTPIGTIEVDANFSDIKQCRDDLCHREQNPVNWEPPSKNSLQLYWKRKKSKINIFVFVYKKFSLKFTFFFILCFRQLNAQFLDVVANVSYLENVIYAIVKHVNTAGYLTVSNFQEQYFFVFQIL